LYTGETPVGREYIPGRHAIILYFILFLNNIFQGEKPPHAAARDAETGKRWRWKLVGRFHGADGDHVATMAKAASPTGRSCHAAETRTHKPSSHLQPRAAIASNMSACQSAEESDMSTATA
jgi:hypothetical protein